MSCWTDRGGAAAVEVLPSRAGVYFVLALGLFPHLGDLRVWAS